MKNEFNTTNQNGEDVRGYSPYSLMLKRRTIVVEGQVNQAMAGDIIRQLKYLQGENPKAEITMMINSPGGSVTDGLAIFDVMREITCPIRTVGVGMQASMGSVLLAGGDTRIMTKNSQLLIHQIMGGASGGTQHSDFEISAAFMAKEHEALKSIYVEFTGLNHKFWDTVGERDTWFTAEQALKLGFIHEVSEDGKKPGPFAADAKRTEKSRLATALDNAIVGFIETATAQEITSIVNNGSGEGGIYSRLRPELLVKLAEFPEYWTPTRAAAVNDAEKASPAAANDDLKKSKKAGGAAPK